MSSIAATRNSTNVRKIAKETAMHTSERTGRVVAFSLTLWGGLVASAAIDGVLAKLSDETLVALAIFALAYASATWFVDAALRGYARESVRAPLAVVAWMLVAALAWVAADATHAVSPLATWAGALAAFFAAPLAVVVTAAAVERAWAATLSAAKRPGARPAGI
jgi:hypothetical protein